MSNPKVLTDEDIAQMQRSYSNRGNFAMSDAFDLATEVIRLRAQVETMKAENAERAEAITALLEDRLMADGRSVHLLICNFQGKKQGDRHCNCPLGNRIDKAERERDALQAENAALHAQIVATAWVRAEDQETPCR